MFKLCHPEPRSPPRRTTLAKDPAFAVLVALQNQPKHKVLRHSPQYDKAIYMAGSALSIQHSAFSYDQLRSHKAEGISAAVESPKLVRFRSFLPWICLKKLLKVRESASKKLPAASFQLLATTKSNNQSADKTLKKRQICAFPVWLRECVRYLLYRDRIFTGRRKIVWRPF